MEAEASVSTRRWRIALWIYVALTAVYLACAPHERLTLHTPFNHFAHLAKSWLEGRLDMVTPPPAYAENNDFALYGDRWFIVFPAFPAVFLLPAVKLARSVEDVRDGQIFILLAGLGPALSFLAFERLRDSGRSALSTLESAGLAVLLGVGTVYFFSAEQGTVWFAAHVISVSLAALFLLFSLDGAHPVLAGLVLGLAFFTRAPLLFAAPLFIIEAFRASAREPALGRAFATRMALFALPLGLLLGLAYAHNRARFGDGLELGYRYLTIGWQGRIAKWGLFSYHYFPRNLGVVLSSLPFYNLAPGPEAARFQLTIHGLALWATTPLYLALLWPKVGTRSQRWTFATLAVTALIVAMPSLFYQNTGQQQFGFRFSNDVVVFLFAMLAVSRPRLSPAFWAIGALGVAVNLFGALSFQRTGWERWYTNDRNIHQPD